MPVIQSLINSILIFRLLAKNVSKWACLRLILDIFRKPKKTSKVFGFAHCVAPQNPQCIRDRLALGLCTDTITKLI